MQSMQTIASVLEVLDLLRQLKTQSTPQQLQAFVQRLASDRVLMSTLIQALQTIPIDNQYQHFLCLYLSKALNLSDFGTFETESYLALFLNWRICQKAKEMMVNGFNSLLINIEEDDKYTIWGVFREMAKMIKEITLDQTKAHNRSRPIDSLENIEVNYPEDVNQLIQTYLLMLRSILCHSFSLFQEDSQQIKNHLECLHNIKQLIFERENIKARPEAVLALVEFYLDLRETAVVVDPQEETLGMFLDLDLKLWQNFTTHLMGIYTAQCQPRDDDSWNFIQCFRLQSGQVSPSLVSLKVKAAEFHQLTLIKLLDSQPRHRGLRDLVNLVPSVILTIAEFINSKSIAGQDEETFVTNLALLLQPFLRRSQLQTQYLLNLMVTSIIPLCQKAIFLMESSLSSGQELHSHLSACLDLQDLGSLMSTSTIIISELLDKDPLISKFFGSWYAFSLLQGQYQCDIDEDLKTFLIDLGEMQPKTLFFVSSIVYSKDKVTSKDISLILSNIINEEYLLCWSSAELNYLFFLLQTSCSDICQLDRISSCLMRFVLAPRAHPEEFQYFGLSFLSSFFQSFFDERWFQMFIVGFHLYNCTDSLNLKWQILHHLCSFLDDVPPRTVLLLVQSMKKGAQSELLRMIHQRQSKGVVDYGQSKYYLGSCRKITKMLSVFKQKTDIADSLLDFVLLVDLAGRIDEENQLVLVALDLAPHLERENSLHQKVILVFDQMVLAFRRGHCKSWTLTCAVLRYLLLLSKIGGLFDHKTFLEAIQQGIQQVPQSNQPKKQELMAVRRSVFIFQKYIQWFSKDETCLSLLMLCKNMITSFESSPSQHNQEEGRVALQCRIIELMLYLQEKEEIDYEILTKYAVLELFDPYMAQLTVYLLGKSFPFQSLENQVKILDLSICLLVFAKESKQMPKDTLRRQLESQLREDPFISVHNKIGQKIFEPSLFCQIWLLLHKSEVKDEQTCLRTFPGFNQQSLQLLLFFHMLQNEKNLKKREEISMLTEQIVNKIKKRYRSAYLEQKEWDSNQRRLWRVTGDKITLQTVDLESTTPQKRTFYGKSIDLDSQTEKEEEDLSFSFEASKEDHTVKLIHGINDKAIRYIVINDQEEVEKQIGDNLPEKRLQNDYSWTRLAQSISHLAFEEITTVKQSYY